MISYVEKRKKEQMDEMEGDNVNRRPNNCNKEWTGIGGRKTYGRL